MHYLAYIHRLEINKVWRDESIKKIIIEVRRVVTTSFKWPARIAAIFKFNWNWFDLSNMELGDNKDAIDSYEDERDILDGSDGPKVKKTRRKLIKSCAFCRKRKLRCDQKKPICATCSQRRFSTCIYPSYDASEQIFGPEPVQIPSAEDDLRRRIAELETKLREAQLSDNEVEKVPNPLRDLFWLQTKDNGRRIIFGPTAMRTFVMKSNKWGFLELWRKVKIARDQLKRKTGHTMLKENCLVEVPFTERTTSHLPLNLVQETCAALPSYETILRLLTVFFEEKNLFEINEMLDQKKVIDDFRTAFVAGPPLPLTSERPIVNILPFAKKNYYPVGVIIGILSLVYYRVKIPTEIERFLVFLTGLSTAKVMYVERIQMLFLRYYYRASVSGCPDSSHYMILVNSLVQEAVQMGLNRPIRTVFKDQETHVGRLDILENLWCWILIADFDVAFHGGQSLQVTPELIHNDNFFNDDSRTSYGLLKRFLKMVRPMVHSVYGKYKPDLEAHEEKIIDFIETELPPIWFLTEAKRVDAFSIVEERVLCHLLSMLLSFNGLRFLVYGEVSARLKNGGLLTSMISFIVCINLLHYAHEQDMKSCPPLTQNDSKELGPHLTRAVTTTAKLLARAISMFYGIAYYKLTLFESGLMIANPHINEQICDFKTLRVQSDMHLSLMGSFELFRNMFDGLLSDRLFRMNVLRSYSLTIFFTMERVGRVIIDKVLEYRTSAENAWIAQFQKDLTPEDPGFILSADEPMPPALPINEDEIKPDMAGLISEDFWASYNLGLEELMSKADTDKMFSDFMLWD